MSNANYIKLKTRLIGALYNALAKDPSVSQRMLEKAFRDACKKLIENGKLAA